MSLDRIFCQKNIGPMRTLWIESLWRHRYHQWDCSFGFYQIWFAIFDTECAGSELAEIQSSTLRLLAVGVYKIVGKGASGEVHEKAWKTEPKASNHDYLITLDIKIRCLTIRPMLLAKIAGAKPIFCWRKFHVFPLPSDYVLWRVLWWQPEIIISIPNRLIFQIRQTQTKRVPKRSEIKSFCWTG